MQTATAPDANSHIPIDTDNIVRGSMLLGDLRDLLRRKHYSISTEQAYLDWARRYILFHGKRHPNDMGEAGIVAFLNHLAVHRKVAASTQNHFISSIVFNR
ncbi:site-specific integrase [Magnetovirga frankeli]|uniref:site-specific integrase n=1 Tax=Magnetovirga frankeli TaxID=947516 RepID=UPI003D32E097